MNKTAWLVIVFGILYVVYSNWSWGEKYLLGNNIRSLIAKFKGG
jgi:hypothetical protein